LEDRWPVIITPRNWKSFQHYNDRRPAWVKLHRELLDNFEFHRLPVASRALAPMLWLIASESDAGEIDADAEKLAFRLRMSAIEMEAALKPLIAAKFFEVVQSASAPLAEPERNGVSERETEEEEEREEETEHLSGSDAPRGTSNDAIGQQAARVFAHWCATHSHPRAKLDAKRRKLIRAALADYTEADLCLCITGYLNSPHHMGKNDRNTVYDDIEIFLRDAKHIDAGLKFAADPPRTDLSRQTRQIIDQTAGWKPPEMRHAAN
jgi:hypothetical protein